MLGLGDSGVTAAYLLTLASTAVCVIYGCVNWNRPSAEESAREVLEEEEWEKRELNEIHELPGDAR